MASPFPIAVGLWGIASGLVAHRYGMLLIGIGLDQAGADALYDKVKTARCLREGEPPQQWPDPTAEFPVTGTPADPAAPLTP